MILQIKRSGSIVLFILCVLTFNKVLAQEVLDEPIEIQIYQASQYKNIVTHVLKITNNTVKQQQGVISLDTPEGISSLSTEGKKYNVEPGKKN